MFGLSFDCCCEGIVDDDTDGSPHLDRRFAVFLAGHTSTGTCARCRDHIHSFAVFIHGDIRTFRSVMCTENICLPCVGAIFVASATLSPTVCCGLYVLFMIAISFLGRPGWVAGLVAFLFTVFSTLLAALSSPCGIHHPTRGACLPVAASTVAALVCGCLSLGALRERLRLKNVAALTIVCVFVPKTMHIAPLCLCSLCHDWPLCLGLRECCFLGLSVVRVWDPFGCFDTAVGRRA